MTDSLRNFRLVGICLHAGSSWQGFDGLNDEIAREIRADETDHLVVVQSSYDFVVGSRVEHFLDLLQERLAIQLSCAHEGIFTQQNVLSTQSSVEIFVQKVKRAFIASLQNDLDGVLQVNAHLI